GGERGGAGERRGGEVRGELDRLVDAIAKGYGDPADLGPKTRALGIERRAIEAELAAAEPAPVVTLHAAALKRYESLIGRLQEAIATSDNPEDSAAIRHPVETVPVRPGTRPGRGGDVIEGGLAGAPRP